MTPATQQIPAGWKTISLGEIVDLINGRGFKSSEWAKSGLPIIRIQNLNGSQEHNFFDGQYNKKHLVNQGDLLFAWSGSRGTSFGPTIWKNEPGLLNQHIYRVIVKNTVDQAFLYYSLLRITSLIEEGAHGSAGLVHVTKKELEKFKIVLPPQAIQTKIATILSKVDEEIEKVEQIIEQTEKLKKGLMQKLLTKGIGHKKFKETELGEIPEGWEVKTLDQICKKIVGGGTPSRKESNYWNGSILWATVKDMDSKLYLNSTQETITDEGLKRSASNLIPKKSIITSTRMGIGRFYINTEDMAINQDLKGLILKDNIDLHFALLSLLSRAGQLERMGTGTTVKGIKVEILKNLQLPVPSLQEQKKIVKILLSIFNKVNFYRYDKIQLTKLKKGLMADLLSGKVRT